MLQRYKVKGIGAAFLAEAVPKLQVFWTLDETQQLLSTRNGDVLCLATAQPPMAAAHHSSLASVVVAVVAAPLPAESTQTV